MKYKVILKDEEVEQLLDMKYENLGQALTILKDTIPNFDLKDTRTSIFSMLLMYSNS